MLVTPTDIRNEFRIETAVPDELIQREISIIDAVFSEDFGQIYVDASTSPASHPTEAKWFTLAIKDLTVCLLFKDDYVITGFGVVRKKDEFSENINYEEVTQFARQCLKNTSMFLNYLDIDKRVISNTLQKIQPFEEGFFEKRPLLTTLRHFNPYVYHRF